LLLFWTDFELILIQTGKDYNLLMLLLLLLLVWFGPPFFYDYFYDGKMPASLDHHHRRPDGNTCYNLSIFVAILIPKIEILST